MDNFSAHNAAAEYLQRQQILKHTTIIFLPPNVTSLHQPLDQGIIAAWKAHYKREWLFFMLQEVERKRDPFERMDVLRALRWSYRAWNIDVTIDTVRNCWIKSGLLGPVYSCAPPPGRASAAAVAAAVAASEIQGVRTELQSLLRRVAAQQGIQSVLTVDKFISPADEVVIDDAEDVEAHIIEVYSIEHDVDTGEDGIDEPIKAVTLAQAIEGLQQRIQYEEQQGDGGDKLLQLERDMRHLLMQQATVNKHQTSMLTYLGPNTQ